MLKITISPDNLEFSYDPECQKQVLVLRGLPGSGKSFIADSFRGRAIRKNDDQTVVCSTDDFFMVDGLYRFDPTQLTEAHHTCFRKFTQAVDRDVEIVVVDNTNIYAAEFAPYVTYAASREYEVKILTVWCGLETAFERQSHNVPIEVLIKMYAALLKNDVVPPYFQHEVLYNGWR